MRDTSSVVLGLLLMLSGIVTFWRGANADPPKPEVQSTEFAPERWSGRSLRLAGVGMFLVGVVMLAGQYAHLL